MLYSLFGIDRRQKLLVARQMFKWHRYIVMERPI
jgi:hypothetical protein